MDVRNPRARNRASSHSQLRLTSARRSGRVLTLGIRSSSNRSASAASRPARASSRAWSRLIRTLLLYGPSLAGEGDRSRHSIDGEEAGLLVPVHLHRVERGLVLRAPRLRLEAAGPEAAAGRWVHRRGHVTREDDAP